MKKLLALALAVMMLVGMTPLESKAAGKVKLNKTSSTIYVGKSTTLKVMNTGKKVKWSSSNKNIAKVSSKGKVTGRKAGKAVITAKVSGKKYTCKVKVKNPYLSVTKKTITQGKNFTLVMKGSTVVKWSSSDKSVATVSSKGKVKAKKKGTATITCKCKNGKKYKCKVTVKKKSNNGNSNNGNPNNGMYFNGIPMIAEDGHLHKYKEIRTIKEASDNGFGEKEYVCQVKGCGVKTTMPYGKKMTYTYTMPDTKEKKTAVRYGYWDTKSAKEILESINKYRRGKGLSELKYLTKYEPYTQKQVMSCYFDVCDFNITPDDKSLRFIGNDIGSDCQASTYFQVKPGYLQPGNDGKNNAALFEKEGIEVGVACFKWTSYSNPTVTKKQQCYSQECWQPVTVCDIVICIFENKSN